jgi:regulator of nonsense transcripts 1
MVECVNTRRWFCNGRINSSASCIINHLVHSKNRVVQLHKDSALGDQVLECYVTGSRNILKLGFVPFKCDNTVILLSRDVTMTNKTLPAIEELGLDISLWQPLIEDRQLAQWLVNEPTEKERIQARHLSSNQIQQLESLWSVNSSSPICKFDKQEHFTYVENISPRYKDGYHYQNVFAPLIKLEAVFDKAVKDSLKMENTTVRWEVVAPTRHFAYFLFSNDSNDTKLVPGDGIKLRLTGLNQWMGRGHIVGFTEREEVMLEMKRGQIYPIHQKTGFTVEFDWKPVCFDRMQEALKIFAVNEASISGPLYHHVLGHNLKQPPLQSNLPQDISGPPGLPSLNNSQTIAVRETFNQHLSLIQGPPGTGKTITSANIVFYMTRVELGQVLVSAPSNVAADQLAEKISLTGLKVLRLTSKATETLESSVKHLRLLYKVDNLELPSKLGKEFTKYRNLKEIQGKLNDHDEKRYKALKRDMEKELLQDAEVVCCTCTTAGDPRINRFIFRQVLIDEATQACEPEAIIPMVNGAKQLVLVGDHLQLGPRVMNKIAANAGLKQSIFERLIFTGIKPYRLTVQFRMHPFLSEFPSNTFYEGSLQNGVKLSDKIRYNDFPWPQQEKPMIFHVNMGIEEISASGVSYLNRHEASNVERIVTLLLRNGIMPMQIGVITPYDGQKALIQQLMERTGPLHCRAYLAIEVASIDAFQGREKDYIILSCVRSNEMQGIGFLCNSRRLNVALTRAKLGLIILGNPKVLSQHLLWNSLLMHSKHNGCLVDGPITNLKISSITIPRPNKE